MNVAGSFAASAASAVATSSRARSGSDGISFPTSAARHSIRGWPFASSAASSVAYGGAVIARSSPPMVNAYTFDQAISPGVSFPATPHCQYQVPFCSGRYGQKNDHRRGPLSISSSVMPASRASRK